MSRILSIELRRSAALGTALIIAAAGLVLLFFLPEADSFAGGWVQLAMTQRLFLAVLWPLALAAGAWQGSREQRSKVGELFSSVPRPRSHQVVPTLGVMAIAVIAGYLAMGVGGGLWIVSTAEYLPVAFFAVTAVGLLALVAAACLGLAVGRMLPRLITAPALAIAGLALLLFIPFLTKPHGWLALVFSPIVEMNMPNPYTTVPGPVSAAQAIWMIGLGATAVLLFAATGRRTRMAAALPLVVGAALAVTVIPHQNRVVTDSVDPVARELVCSEDAPRVCVMRAHAGLLAEVTPPAREGLAALRKLPGAPTTVHEDSSVYPPDNLPAWQADVALLPVTIGRDGHLADRDGVVGKVVAGAFGSPPTCENYVGMADRTAAAYWLLGREPVPYDVWDTEGHTIAVGLWNDMRQLPEDEAMARVVALRQAARDCTGAGLFDKGTP